MNTIVKAFKQFDEMFFEPGGGVASDRLWFYGGLVVIMAITIRTIIMMGGISYVS